MAFHVLLYDASEIASYDKESPSFFPTDSYIPGGLSGGFPGTVPGQILGRKMYTEGYFLWCLVSKMALNSWENLLLSNKNFNVATTTVPRTSNIDGDINTVGGCASMCYMYVWLNHYCMNAKRHSD